MPSYCCAYNCTSKAGTVSSKNLGIRFFRFPRDKERRALWAAAVRRADFVPNDYTRICSLHFVFGI